MSARRAAVGFLVAAGELAVVAGIATAKLNTRADSTTIPGRDNGNATARCPRGSEPVSGGFSGDAVFAFTSKRVSHRRWKVSAYNQNSVSYRHLVAHAYCDKHEPRLRSESKEVMIPADRKHLVTVNCPHGRKEVSGGFAAAVDTDGNGPFVFTSKRTKVFRSNRTKVRGRHWWEAAAAGKGSGGPFPFRVIAYCKKT